MTMQTTASVLRLMGLTAQVAEKVKKIISDVSSGDLDPAKIQETIRQATEQAIEDVLAEVQGLDATDLLRVTDIQREVSELRNELSPVLKFAVDFFHSKYSLAEILQVGQVNTVAGDDSIDLADSSKVEVGQEYIIQKGMIYETVIIKEVLTANRIRTLFPVTNSMTGGTLTKTNWTYLSGIENSGSTKATAETGQTYYSGPINVDSSLVSDSTKAVIIRLNDLAEIPELYFREVGDTAWSEAVWNWDRPTNDGENKDIEFNFKAAGNFEIKVVSTSASVFDFILCITSPSGLEKGVHHPPEAPSIGFPAGGVTDVGEQPALTISGFVSPTGTELKGTYFQVSTVEGDFSEENLVINTGIVAGYSFTPAKGILQSSTTYYVRAKVEDEYDTQSAWSDATSFTTKSAFVSIDVPSAISPSASEVLGSHTDLTLVSGSFSYTGDADTHAASQWQLATDPLFVNLLHDSGEDAVNLTSLNIADGTIERGGTYFWRVRFKGGTSGEWSDWSASTAFSVLAYAPGVRVDGGIVVGQFSSASGDGDFWLIAAPASQRVQRVWGTYGTDTSLPNVTTDTDQNDGQSNTTTLTASYSATAAQYCADLSFEGVEDYFLPNKQELDLIHNNWDAVENGDDTTGNTLTAIGATNVWASSERNSLYAWCERLTSGEMNTGLKNQSRYVIPCRREAV